MVLQAVMGTGGHEVKAPPGLNESTLLLDICNTAKLAKYRICLNSSRAGILLEQKLSSELFESAN